MPSQGCLHPPLISEAPNIVGSWRFFSREPRPYRGGMTDMLTVLTLYRNWNKVRYPAPDAPVDDDVAAFLASLRIPTSERLEDPE